jgi:hypothetical protein
MGKKKHRRRAEAAGWVEAVAQADTVETSEVWDRTIGWRVALKMTIDDDVSVSIVLKPKQARRLAKAFAKEMRDVPGHEVFIDGLYDCAITVRRKNAVREIPAGALIEMPAEGSA